MGDKILDCFGFTPDSKGRYGEKLIAEELKRLGENYIVRNIYIPSYNNQTIEVDVVLVHNTGIYVFESKNLSGIIYGDEQDKQWTICSSGRKYQLYNPITQNKTHMNALAKYLKISTDKMISYIVFSERCSFGKVPNNKENWFVVKRHQICENLKQQFSSRPTIWNDDETMMIYYKLLPLNAVPDEEIKEHIREVKEKHSGNVCAKCGAKMVERSGKYGKFLGCSNYPKCTYTRNIQSQQNVYMSPGSYAISKSVMRKIFRGL